MLPLLLTLAVAAPAPDAIETEIGAIVAEDLQTVRVSVDARWTLSRDLEGVPIVLAADRHRTVESPMPPAAEKSLYPYGHRLGGFSEINIIVDGAPCQPRFRTLAAGARLAICDGGRKAGQTISIKVRAVLQVPNRFGPFGWHGRQLTLGGGWYPYPGRSGEAPPVGMIRGAIRLPADTGAVIGPRYFPPILDGQRRKVEVEHRGSQLPLVVLPSSAAVAPVGGGRILHVRPHPTSPDAELRSEEIVSGLDDALRFLIESNRPAPTKQAPLIVVEAPLHHNLARAGDGLVLVSDRAFRLFPHSRFLRFHRFPLLREVFTAIALRSGEESSPLRHVRADAVGSWWGDRYVASRFGSAEDAFDVLQLWSFIPAVDSLLYAPQLPFVGAYFRLIREEDVLRYNLIDFPHPAPRGKIIYEKLVDRLGGEETNTILEQAMHSPLREVVRAALGQETDDFFRTWLGAYPDVRYALGAFDSAPAECDGVPCHEARVEIQRDGDEIAEPIQVLLEDDEGDSRLVWVPPSKAPLRVLTATLSAPLAFVNVDPFGRLAETPSEEVGSPRFDNRSSSRWRVLLNNFNLLVGVSAAQIDTALDIGFSRVRDVHWRFATRLAYSPSSVSVSTRAVRYFGRNITPDRLNQWVGVLAAGEYLRPSFGAESRKGLALSTLLYYGFDDRRTTWAPEPGTGLRLAVGFNRLIGEDGDDNSTKNAFLVSARGLRSWRLGGAHQFSVRGSLAGYVAGTPREQLLFSLGGRSGVRGYDLGALQGRYRGIVSGEWVHPLLGDLDINFFELSWVSGLDGALYADAAVLADDLGEIDRRSLYADVGYGLRFYIDYFGVRPGVMSVDIAFPLVDEAGQFGLASPAVYIDFAQSFFIF